MKKEIPWKKKRKGKKVKKQIVKKAQADPNDYLKVYELIETHWKPHRRYDEFIEYPRIVRGWSYVLSVVEESIEWDKKLLERMERELEEMKKDPLFESITEYVATIGGIQGLREKIKVLEELKRNLEANDPSKVSYEECWMWVDIASSRIHSLWREKRSHFEALNRLNPKLFDYVRIIAEAAKQFEGIIKKSSKK